MAVPNIEALLRIAERIRPPRPEQKQAVRLKSTEAADLRKPQPPQALKERNFKRGRKRTEVPLSSALDIPLSDRMHSYIKDFVEAEHGGVRSPMAEYKLAHELKVLAVIGQLDPHETLRVIDQIASQYTGDKTEMRKYQTLVRELLLIAPDTAAERSEVVNQAKQQLEKSAQADDINPEQRDEMVKVLDQEMGEVQKILQQQKEDPRLIDIEEYSSPQARIRAVEANDHIERSISSERMMKQLDAVAENVVEDFNIPEEDATRLVTNIEDVKRTRGREYQDVPHHISDKLKDINVRLVPAQQEITHIREKYLETETDASGKVKKRVMPAELKSLIDETEAGIGGYDPANPAESRDPRKIPADSLNERINHLEGEGLLASEQATTFRTALRIFAEKAQLAEMAQDIPDSYRLREVGIAGENYRWYTLATNPEKFMKALMEHPDKNAFYHEFRQGVEGVTQHLLSVIDSDFTQFSDQIFSQLIYEPIYNSISVGLNGIQNQIRNLELKGESIDVVIEKFHRKKHKEMPTIFELSGAIEDLRIWVSDEKFIKRYTHNVYVLMLSHNYESFAKYAEQVPTGLIQRLFENNPELELAKNQHVSYVWARHGLNNWKSLHEIFTPGVDGKIAVDEYVRRKLETQTNLSSTDIQRLTHLARGVALGVTMEDIDVILQSGPVLSGKTGASSLTQQFGPIHWNPFMTPRRFFADFPFPRHEFMFRRIGKTGFRWRNVAAEIEEAQKVMQERATKERSRFYTDQEVESDGVVFADMFALMMQSGGWGNRRYRWRGEVGLEHFMYVDIEHNGKTVRIDDINKIAKLPKSQKLEKLDEIIRRIAIADPQAANGLLEQWYGRGWVDKKGRGELRRTVWNRVLKDIAPQAALVLEKDLIFSEPMQKILKRFMKDDDFKDLLEIIEITIDGKKQTKIVFKPETPTDGNEHASNILEELILDSEAVSAFLIYAASGDDDRGGELYTKTMKDLGDTDAWYEALYSAPERRPKSITSEEAARLRARRVQKFMTELRSNFSEALIEGKVDAFYVPYNDPRTNKPKLVTIPALGDVLLTISFPSQYGIKREMEWSQMGDRVLARLVGDSETTGQSWTEIFKSLRDTIFDISAMPEKAQEAHFIPLLETIRKQLANPTQDVHGTASPEIIQAQVYMAGYAVIDQVLAWFDRGTAARHFGASLFAKLWHPLAPYTSWENWKTQSTQAEIESQVVRKVIDLAVHYNLIAPTLGHIITDSDFKHIGPFRYQVPIDHWENIRIGGKELPIKRPVLKQKTPWNAARLQMERGGLNFNLALDIVPKWIGIVMLLLILAALQKSTTDTEGQK